MAESWIISSLIIFFICLIVAAFFSAVETAVISSNKLRLKYFAKKGNKKAKIISNILKMPDEFLRIVLIGTNIAIIISSSVSSSLAIYFYGDMGISVSVLVTTLIILIFCEILPKTIGQYRADNISLNAAYLVKAISIFFLPIEIVLKYISYFIIRILTGKKYIPSKAFCTKKDLQKFFEYGNNDGAIEKREIEMVYKVLNLDNIYVKDVMISKENIKAIEKKTLVKDVLDLMNREGLSRIPIYKENLDNIVGFLHAKDFFVNNLEKKLDMKVDSLKSMHQPYFVSETTRAINLLSDLQKQGTHIAVVLDQDKKVSGILTIEDLLEEIFGNIEDEFDKNR